ncbi:MAG: flagellar hook assembly protein FlgD [bacterium]
MLSGIDGTGQNIESSDEDSNEMLSGVHGTGQNIESSPESRVSDGTEDSNKFMKLLLEQLKNQDPMNPMSNEKFVGQMAQLTTLEKMNSLASDVDKLAKSKQSDKFMNLLGSHVNATTADNAQVEGQVRSVKFTEAGAEINIGGQELSSEEITKISLPGLEETGGEETGGTE